MVCDVCICDAFSASILSFVSRSIHGGFFIAYRTAISMLVDIQ